MESEGSLPCSQEIATVPILSHTFPSHFLHIHFNIILPVTPRSFWGSPFSRLSKLTSACSFSLSRASYMSCSLHLDLIILTIFREDYKPPNHLTKRGSYKQYKWFGVMSNQSAVSVYSFQRHNRAWKVWTHGTGLHIANRGDCTARDRLCFIRLPSVRSVWSHI
jgi:hypothetical protein